MVFVVSQKPHALFERRGNNLVFRTTVRLRDALVGGELRVKSLDDRQIKMQFKVRAISMCFLRKQ
jgi:DnaJ-class molecular chaperone